MTRGVARVLLWGSVILSLLACADAVAQCAKDTDCKGDRICVNDHCVAPDPAPAASAPSVSTAPRSAVLQTPPVEQKNPFRVHRIVATTTLAVLWTVTLIGSAVIGDAFIGTTVIPVVGPFITYLRVDGNPNYVFLSGGQPLLLISGTLQSALAIYLVVSIIMESNWDPPRFAILPGPTPLGATVSMRF